MPPGAARPPPEGTGVEKLQSPGFPHLGSVGRHCVCFHICVADLGASTESERRGQALGQGTQVGRCCGAAPAEAYPQMADSLPHPVQGRTPLESPGPFPWPLVRRSHCICDLIPGDQEAGARPRIFSSLLPHGGRVDRPPGLIVAPHFEQKERDSFPTITTDPVQTDNSGAFRGPPRRTVVATLQLLCER